MNNPSLLKEILQFGKARLSKAETRFTTEDGLRCIETQDEHGEFHLKQIEGADTLGYVVDTNPDLQVGQILPGLLLSRLTYITYFVYIYC